MQRQPDPGPGVCTPADVACSNCSRVRLERGKALSERMRRGEEQTVITRGGASAARGRAITSLTGLKRLCVKRLLASTGLTVCPPPGHRLSKVDSGPGLQRLSDPAEAGCEAEHQAEDEAGGEAARGQAGQAARQTPAHSSSRPRHGPCTAHPAIWRLGGF